MDHINLNKKSFLNHAVFKEIAELAKQENTEAYVIGGYVRDKLLGRSDKKDIDIVVQGNGIDFARKLSEKLGVSNLSIFKTYGTAMFNFQDTELEFVGARRESYSKDSRNPVVESGSIEDDQRRRDFTINALAISLNIDNYGELIDPFNGLSDLENKVIRTPLDPDITFSDDPLRMMRAIRFATQLNFDIEEGSFDAIMTNKERIGIITAERIHTELNKIIMADKPSKGFKLLFKSGLLEIIFPELFQLSGVEKHGLVSHKDNFLHTIQVLDNLAKYSDDLWLRWAALLHDIAKPRTKKFIEGIGWTFHAHNFIGAKMVPNIFLRLKLPLNEKMKFVQKMVDLHMRPIALVEDVVTDSAIRRLIVDAGEDIDALMTLCEADITSKNEKKVEQYIENFKNVRKKIVEVEERDSLRNFQPPVSGEEIMAFFGIPGSRTVGDIKGAIKEAILQGIIPNEYEAAKKHMIKIGEEMGLSQSNK
ncbi:MAG: HD domain-containing protein [Bacteroidales bacterium]|nr:HD domain-containing protein [Bacteroidales bacterium]MDY0141626.1 HD domain-containing protein [Bacteroidales bacterium]